MVTWVCETVGGHNKGYNMGKVVVTVGGYNLGRGVVTWVCETVGGHDQWERWGVVCCFWGEGVVYITLCTLHGAVSLTNFTCGNKES